MSVTQCELVASKGISQIWMIASEDYYRARSNTELNPSLGIGQIKLFSILKFCDSHSNGLYKVGIFGRFDATKWTYGSSHTDVSRIIQ